MEVGREAAEPVAVHEHFSSLETVPVAVGCGFRNAGVYPTGWDGVGELVVEDCLEWGKDLDCC